MSSALHALNRWDAHAPPGAWVPDAIVRMLEREQAVDRALEKARVVDPRWSADVAALREQIEADNSDRAARRDAEDRLADYIEAVALAHPVAGELHGLQRLVERMRQCRRNGTVGLTEGGGYVVVWDHKCDQVRLCPDEARDETRRVADRYVPHALAWLREKPGRRRLFWCVLTDYNVPPGLLAEGKRDLFDRFRSYVWRGRYQACPLERFRGTYVRTRRRTMPKFPTLKGALLVQEDPLAAAGDWNVHLNALLLVEGPLSYAELREEWGRNLHVEEVRTRDEEQLRRTVAELVKYAALAVPSKSAEKAADGSSPAPAMIEWPTDRWLEWWAAQQGFRRTRSYGELHGIPAPPTVPLEGVRWCGVIAYQGGCYRATIGPPMSSAGCVDSIPGNNFRGSGAPHGPDPPQRPTERPPGYQ